MVRHILGISGGKDSAALAIYMKDKYPDLKVDYYNSDTGCELEETEVLINRLESYFRWYYSTACCRRQSRTNAFRTFFEGQW